MIGFSYTLSPLLHEYIQKIESLRVQILTTALSPKVELRLRFDGMISRVYWSVNLSGNLLTKAEIEELIVKTYPLFATKGKKQLSDDEKGVLAYKRAHDVIAHEWLVNTKPVRTKDILELAGIVCTKKLRDEAIDLTHLCDYLHNSTDHPVVQAAVAQMQVLTMRPFVDGNGRIARLLAQLYLYKFGYDFRGFLALDEYWRRDVASLDVIKTTVLKANSLNLWIEYFAQGLVKSLEKVTERTKTQSFLQDRTNNWQLTDRQRQIVSVLDFPHATITNRKVQKHFKVSQITASRDLAKLTVLGLVVPHGKGRSIYYTRV